MRREQNWGDKTPMIGGSTPGYSGATPTPSHLRTPDMMKMAPTKLDELRWERELEIRNKAITDEELDLLLPGKDDGFEIVKQPENYEKG